MSGSGQMCEDEDRMPLQWRNHADEQSLQERTGKRGAENGVNGVCWRVEVLL